MKFIAMHTQETVFIPCSCFFVRLFYLFVCLVVYLFVFLYPFGESEANNIKKQI